ncbi:MAG: putative toxin-antitoxin system toxin component, PIN family, partial [Chloroflexota bacterium]
IFNTAYNTIMRVPGIVIDTNVVIAALRSRNGASFKLLSLVGTNKFEIHDSVAIVLENEDIIQRFRAEAGLSQDDVSIFVDSLCSMAHHHKIYFVWRPSLPDANDELFLELAISAGCDYIVTHNIKDFKGTEKFGIKAITPKEFLQIIGEVTK